jgi:hypothetical protein
VTDLSDDAYMQVQDSVQFVANLLLDPGSPGRVGLGEDALDLFIQRADRALSLGPIIHPSEFQTGAGKLQEALAHARALRTAREAILKSIARTVA